MQMPWVGAQAKIPALQKQVDELKHILSYTVPSRTTSSMRDPATKKSIHKVMSFSQVWEYFNLAPRRLRQEDFWEFQDRLSYRMIDTPS